MKDLKFREITATYKDTDGDEHESTVRAAVVSDDLVMIDFTNGEGEQARRRREVTDRGGNAVRLNAGDVVVETEKPGVYDVHSADAWKTTGYADSGNASGDAEQPTDAQLLQLHRELQRVSAADRSDVAPSVLDARPPAPARDVMQTPEHDAQPADTAQPPDDAQPADTAQPLGDRPADAEPAPGTAPTE